MTNLPTKSTALYANKEGKVVIHDLPFPEPQQGEILIKVLYSGVNLSDVRAIEFFDLRNYALGGEFCGEVLESPSLTSTPFKAGDIVAGIVAAGKSRESRHAAHQEYITVDPDWVFKLPENLPPQAAAGLSIVVQTASNALFNHLRLPLPPSVAEGTIDKGASCPEGTLVIWGGATGVGMAAIQLGRASRVSSIVAIASAKRHDFLKSLGATHCFDYHDPGVIEKVKQALQGTKGIIWGLDALGSVENPVSQEVLKSAIPPHDEVRLATVLLAPHEGFEAVLGSRQFHVEFSLPNGTTLSFPKDEALADRHWRGFRWVIVNYGGDYKPTPVRVFEGSGKDAIGELHKMWHMNNFGKVVLKHPLHQES
ncbi:Trans-enoyl reductase fsdC [Fusarium oxysporum f. sp. cubense]|uniref:Trans-enoyl reductase fsdC n=1 Tax=Fusarium oxysporum f. sp. cubense TaxID=61366 RepID=A0A559KU14_FUSOC|nr:Trans-enoyl reductase fsdC [Fusarium oxysporum f. sp. cubense]